MKLFKLKLLVFALIVFAVGPAFASYSSYDVTVNTSSLFNTNGIVDFTYISSSGASSIATLSNFVTDGTLGAQDTAHAINNGLGAAGVLPNAVTFTNDPNTTPNTEYIHGITFGNSLTFLVSFSNLASGGQNGGSSTFSLGLFGDTINWTPLMNASDPNYAGTLVSISLNNDGTTSAQSLAPQAGAAPAPIPPTALLLGSGLLGLVGVRRMA